MSLSIILWIMALVGIFGGIVNYLMPSNRDKDDPARLKQGFFESVAIGIGATLLVPLFLEIAQSKLLDDIKIGHSKDKKTEMPGDTGTDQTAAEEAIPPDSMRAEKSQTNSRERSSECECDESEHAAIDELPLKNYLLYSAYCLLASAAGYRFISSITQSVLKEQELEEVKNELSVKEKEKETLETVTSGLEQELTLRKQQNILEARQGEQKVFQALAQNALNNVVPVLPPVTNEDDPQKGRFGGKSESNNRLLNATVAASNVPFFYNVTIWVESTDPINFPLTEEVFFYLHDSLSPSVYSITPAEFRDGKAVDDEIISYGAFTVGVITDRGRTLLELDLASLPNAPEGFRKN